MNKTEQNINNLTKEELFSKGFKVECHHQNVFGGFYGGSETIEITGMFVSNYLEKAGKDLDKMSNIDAIKIAANKLFEMLGFLMEREGDCCIPYNFFKVKSMKAYGDLLMTISQVSVLEKYEKIINLEADKIKNILKVIENDPQMVEWMGKNHAFDVNYEGARIEVAPLRLNDYSAGMYFAFLSGEHKGAKVEFRYENGTVIVLDRDGFII